MTCLAMQRQVLTFIPPQLLRAPMQRTQLHCSYLFTQSPKHLRGHQQWTRYQATTSSASVESALEILSLRRGFTPSDLRDAYFESAKRCHPDSHHQTRSITFKDEHDNKVELSQKFLEITEAYEFLRKWTSSSPSRDRQKGSGDITDEYEVDAITKSEEKQFREAVRENLGIDAEILEESKRCPMFREWLQGRSHMAFHFNLFLMRHGGLAPMLGGKKTAKLGAGSRSIITRRRKRR